jgi:hypothetical protein
MKIACKNIDRLINVGFRPLGMPREDIGELYALCAKDAPVSYKCAKDILAHPGATVGVFTGAAVMGVFPKGESDGPLGAAALARALLKLGYRVNLYTEIDCLAGLSEIAKMIGCEAPIVVLEKKKSLDEPCAQYDEIANLLDIAVCTEKVGVNCKGIQHSVTGRNRNGMRAFVDPIVNRMNDMGKLTIGIGDGGNEIGFGNVYEAACDLIENGRKCVCGCDSGIVNVTKVTHCYPVAISNWGCYAICAALSLFTGNMELMVTPEEEHDMLMRTIELELCDGGSGLPRYALDGIDGDCSVACVRFIREIVRAYFTTENRHF